MMHLALKHGMRIVNEGAETDAYLVLEPATPQSILLEWAQDSLALFSPPRRLHFS